MATQTHEETDQEASKKPVYTNEHPEYPKLLYHHSKRTTATAQDKDDEGKKAKDGFVEEPYGAEDPDSMTAEEVTQLESLLHKAGKALVKLGKLKSSDKNDTHTDKPAEKPAAPPARK